MLITKKHIITFISILSIIGYGYLAFAVINPGDTLDPVTSNPAECPTGPTDPTCIVTFPSSLNEIERGTGAPTSTPTGSDPIFYIDESNGDVYSWDANQWNVLAGGGGSGPFSIVNDYSIFSTGLVDVGTNSTAIFSFFVGEGAGYEATEADFSNFIGDYSGYQAVNAEFSNFIGSNAGLGATDAYYSNFIGTNTGVNATDARYSNFIGHAAGNGATFAEFSNFIGDNAGNGATNAYYSNFLGQSAGLNATNAYYSNFLGSHAGNGATDASFSNFLGQEAGTNSTFAIHSNFFGDNAGSYAANTAHSNFFGLFSGSQATNASNSIFFGTRSGYQDSVNNILTINYSSPSASFELGETVFSSSGGEGLIVSDDGSLLGVAVVGTFDFNISDTLTGNNTGTTATIDSVSGGGTSILIGHNTNTGGFSDSIAMGAYAANTATNQFMMGSSTRPINDLIINGTGSLFLPVGDDAQRTAYATDGAIRYNTDQVCVEVYSGGNWTCLGGGGGSSPFSIVNTNSIFSTGLTNTGLNSTATDSFFVGNSAGNEATNASYSIFIGDVAGDGATNASYSIFMGERAGRFATNASYSNFIGARAGRSATNANDSNFIGSNAGSLATNASYSNFIGLQSGANATNASNSFFAGWNTGSYDSLVNQGTPNAANSIFIGREAAFTLADNGLDNTTNPDDFSILLGNYTSTGGFENSIALGQRATNTASNQFMIGSTTRRIEEMVFNGGVGNTCSIVAGTGISCSSDERLKTNITDLDNTTLDKLLNIQTVTYNWKEGINQNTQIGFIAQNINEYFPELVSTNHDGMLAVNYAGMTPILTKAIQELDLKLSVIESQTIQSGGFTVNSLFDSIRDWLGDIGNGIVRIFAKQIATDELCIGSTCVTESQLIELLNQNGIDNNQSNNNTSSSNDSSSYNNDEQSDLEIQESINNSDEINDSLEEVSSEESHNIASDQAIEDNTDTNEQIIPDESPEEMVQEIPEPSEPPVSEE